MNTLKPNFFEINKDYKIINKKIKDYINQLEKEMTCYKMCNYEKQELELDSIYYLKKIKLKIEIFIDLLNKNWVGINEIKRSIYFYNRIKTKIDFLKMRKKEKALFDLIIEFENKYILYFDSVDYYDKNKPNYLNGEKVKEEIESNFLDAVEAFNHRCIEDEL